MEAASTLNELEIDLGQKRGCDRPWKWWRCSHRGVFIEQLYQKAELSHTAPSLQLTAHGQKETTHLETYL